MANSISGLFDKLAARRKAREMDVRLTWNSFVQSVADGKTSDADTVLDALSQFDKTTDDLRSALDVLRERRELQKVVAGEADLRERQATSTGGKNLQLQVNWPEAEKGQSRDHAAAGSGVSPKSVDRASKVLDKGSKPLQEAVAKGDIAVSQAAKLAELPKSEQTKALAGGKAAVMRSG